MTPQLPPLGDDDLNAFADGRLPPERAREVEALLAHDSALAERVQSIRAQNAALRDAFDPWLAEPIPDRLIAAATPPAPGESRASRWRAPLAAAAATLILGVAIGWAARDAMLEHRGTPTSFAREAALTHVLYSADARRPVEVWAAEEQGLVTWLTRRLGTPVRAPDLNALGYSLVGGRLVAGNAKPTGLFMYENRDKQRLTLQVRKLEPGTKETAFRYAVEDGVGVFYWIEDACAYAISGQLDRGQLLAVARTVYGQLGNEPPPK